MQTFSFVAICTVPTSRLASLGNPGPPRASLAFPGLTWASLSFPGAFSAIRTSKKSIRKTNHFIM